jgi:hypothetical protein
MAVFVKRRAVSAIFTFRVSSMKPAVAHSPGSGRTGAGAARPQQPAPRRGGLLSLLHRLQRAILPFVCAPQDTH